MPATLLPARKRRVAMLPARRPPARRRRSVRATLLWALTTFVVAQISLRAVIDLARPELRDPPFEIKATRLQHAIDTAPARPLTVLMMGSSITGNGFKALDIEKRLAKELGRPVLVFNMSSQGSGPLTALVWMRRLAQRGIRPDLLLVEIAPMFYNASGPPMDMARFPHHILEQGDLELVGRYGQDPDLERSWWTCRLVPSFGHRLTIQNCLCQPLVPMNDRLNLWGGYDERFWQSGVRTSQSERDGRLAAVSRQHEPELRAFEAGQPSLQALAELLQFVHQDGIPTALVMMPKAPSLRRLYHADNLRRVVTDVEGLAARQACDFVHAWDWLDDDMFHDGYHPNDDGAEVFSKRIADELVLPRLRKSGS